MTALILYSRPVYPGNGGNNERDQSKTLTGLILLHRIRKRDRYSERTIITDVYPYTSNYLGIYRLAVKEPEKRQRRQQQRNDAFASCTVD